MYGRSASTRAATSRTPRSAQPVERPPAVGAAATGSAKIVPRLARIAFGLNRSVRGVGGDHRVGAGAVGGPQDRAEVARLLDGLDDDDERRPAASAQRRRAPSTATRTTATTPSDRSPNASLAMTASRHVEVDARTRRQPAERRRAPRRVRTSGVADERLDDLDAGVERPEQLAGPSTSVRPVVVALAPVAQPDRGLDPRVREARDAGRGSVIAPMMRAYAPSRRCAPLRRPHAQLARVDVRCAAAGTRPRARRRAGPARSPACARVRRTNAGRGRSAPRTRPAGPAGAPRGATTGRPAPWP